MLMEQFSDKGTISNLIVLTLPPLRPSEVSGSATVTMWVEGLSDWLTSLAQAI